MRSKRLVLIVLFLAMCLPVLPVSAGVTDSEGPTRSETEIHVLLTHPDDGRVILDRVCEDPETGLSGLREWVSAHGGDPDGMTYVGSHTYFTGVSIDGEAPGVILIGDPDDLDPIGGFAVFHYRQEETYAIAMDTAVHQLALMLEAPVPGDAVLPPSDAGAGENPAQCPAAAVLPGDYGTVADTRWVLAAGETAGGGFEDPFCGRFETGVWYYAEIGVIPDEGMTLDSDLTPTVNGEAPVEIVFLHPDSTRVIARIQAKPLVYGDADDNGAINAADALLALQHAVKLTQLTGRAFRTADVSADGTVNAADALLILQHTVKLISEFPAER